MNRGKLRSLRIFVWGLSIWLATACGPVRKPGEPSNDADQGSPTSDAGLSRLAVRVIEADKANPDLPAGSEGHAPESLSSFGDELTIRDTIDLQRPEGDSLSLVLEGDLFGKPIHDLHYTIEAKDTANRKPGEGRRHPCYRDHRNGRWFVPIREVLQNSSAQMSPTTTYILTFEFQLDGALRQIELAFRARTPLSIRTHEVMASAAITERPTYFRADMGRSGIDHFTWATEAFENPYEFPIKIWVRGGGRILRQTEFLFHHFENRGTRLPRGEVIIAEISSPYLETRGFQIEPQLTSSEPVSFTDEGGGWRSALIPARAPITLSWILVPEQAVTGTCTLPAPATRVFRWNHDLTCDFTPMGCLPGPHHLPVIQVEEEVRTDAWSVVGSMHSGEWSRAVRMTDPFVTKDEATADSARLNPRSVLEFQDSTLDARAENLKERRWLSGSMPRSGLPEYPCPMGIVAY